jgi:hypothetical protein
LSNEIENGSLILFNAKGSKVLEINIENKSRINITGDELSPGIYFLCISSNNKIIATSKLIRLEKP